MSEKKIMIIDDDKYFLQEVKELLISCGYNAVAFSDSNLAFPAVARIKPDVILLDLKMKGIDGLQFADKLRKSQTTKNISIIVMTGFPIDHDCLSFFSSCGIEQYFRKPFYILDVITAIESLNPDLESGSRRRGMSRKKNYNTVIRGDSCNGFRQRRKSQAPSAWLTSEKSKSRG